MSSCVPLLFVKWDFSIWCIALRLGRDWKQQGIKHLLRDDIKGGAESRRNFAAPHALLDM
ncbi:hypothetical protein RN02_12535 [Pseudomonas sp. PI1]|nr:hypothetical protein RN02_12535 [Pseudomonas sp. PI1]